VPLAIALERWLKAEALVPNDGTPKTGRSRYMRAASVSVRYEPGGKRTCLCQLVACPPRGQLAGTSRSEFAIDDQQFEALESAAPDQIEGVDQALEVLVRLDVPDVQDEWAVQLVALPTD